MNLQNNVPASFGVLGTAKADKFNKINFENIHK